MVIRVTMMTMVRVTCYCGGGDDHQDDVVDEPRDSTLVYVDPSPFRDSGPRLSHWREPTYPPRAVVDDKGTGG